ncbi:unnamed protein product, partial [Rhizoctonia solani]
MPEPPCLSVLPPPLLLRLAMEDIQDALPPPTTLLSSLTESQLRMISNLPDHQAWAYSDDILIASSLTRQKKGCITYRHFIKIVERIYRKDSSGSLEPDYINFWYICRHQPNRCKSHRQWGKDHNGTSNLRKAIRKCDKERGVSDSLAVPSPETIVFSQLMFRVLLVIWCIVGHRPFHIVTDPLFLDIVHMLRPEAIVPSPHTLSSDLTYIYNLASMRIRDTFGDMDTGVHLAIDGW